MAHFTNRVPLQSEQQLFSFAARKSEFALSRGWFFSHFQFGNRLRRNWIPCSPLSDTESKIMISRNALDAFLEQQQLVAGIGSREKKNSGSSRPVCYSENCRVTFSRPQQLFGHKPNAWTEHGKLWGGETAFDASRTETPISSGSSGQ